MKRRSPSSFLVAAVILSLMPCGSHAQSKDLTMSWGLENTTHFSEKKELPSESQTKETEAKPKRTIGFTSSSYVVGRIDECAERHFEMWETYQKSHPDPKSRDREEFQQIKRRDDPDCFAYARLIAPTLYFDFVTNNDETYILNTIEVQTLDFHEYKGGGFTENEAWYDIVVPHTKGMKTYEVESKLSFKNKGRAQLGLWSDNYTQYANSGWITPMGAYVIRIIFNFTHNGVSASASTEIFEVDI